MHIYTPQGLYNSMQSIINSRGSAISLIISFKISIKYLLSFPPVLVLVIGRPLSCIVLQYFLSFVGMFLDHAIILTRRFKLLSSFCFRLPGTQGVIPLLVVEELQMVKK